MELKTRTWFIKNNTTGSIIVISRIVYEEEKRGLDTIWNDIKNSYASGSSIAITDEDGNFKTFVKE